jgi:hypothetical protein
LSIFRESDLKRCVNPGEFVFVRYFAGVKLGSVQVCAEHVCFLTGTLLPTVMKEGGTYSVQRNEGVLSLCQAGTIFWVGLLKPSST